LFLAGKASQCVLVLSVL